jgi:hypothetical protein
MKDLFSYNKPQLTKLEIDVRSIMTNLLPKCSKCGSPVADSIEYQI